jgi:ketosteroid isomerase-like protein
MLKRILVTVAASVVALGAIGTVDEVAFAAAGTDAERLAARAAAAHQYMMRGDIAAYRKTLALAPDFTLMDPFGGRPTGVPETDAHWNRIGAFFRNGRGARFDLLASYASRDMVVLVANEHAHVAVGAVLEQNWSLRVTLIFRRDDGAWRLVHRHADPIVTGIAPDKAAVLARGGDR